MIKKLLIVAIFGFLALMIILSSLYGGIFLVANILSITVVVVAIEELMGEPFDNPFIEHDSFYETQLPFGLVILHLILFPFAIWGLLNPEISWSGAIANALAYGLFFGAISLSNAHELIHSSDRSRRRLGEILYASVLFGHHTSAHLLVHHKYVATTLDPSSSPKGTSFYRFSFRCFFNGFRAGLNAENIKRKTHKNGIHPYITYFLISLFFAVVLISLFGWAALPAYIILSGLSANKVMLADYIQHYGLTRALKQNGKYETVSPKHSWDSPQWLSRVLTFNSGRHADHHMHPIRSYTGLKEYPNDAPQMPFGIFNTGFLALFPPLWHKVMDRRLEKWQARQQ